MTFLKEYKIASLAIAFIMGAASTDLVNSLVKDIIMPLLEPLMTSDSWQEATVQIGAISLRAGAFMAELFNFIILGLVIFIVAKKILKLESSK